MDKRKNRTKAGMDLCRFVNSRDIREHLREMQEAEVEELRRKFSFLHSI